MVVDQDLDPPSRHCLPSDFRVPHVLLLNSTCWPRTCSLKPSPAPRTSSCCCSSHRSVGSTADNQTGSRQAGRQIQPDLAWARPLGVRLESY